MNDIFDILINFLGVEYKVIKSFEADENIDLNGVFAVNITDIQPLHHGNTQDCKYGVVINAQTMTDEDKERKIINQMMDYIKALNFQYLKNYIDNCVGVVENSCTITSDGETNNFSFSMSLYICID